MVYKYLHFQLKMKYIHLRSIIAKTVGLMFSRKKEEITVFHFNKPQLIGIHTIFVFYTIDVYWLDKDKKILQKKTMKPFRFEKGLVAKYIVEMPAKLTNKFNF